MTFQEFDQLVADTVQQIEKLGAGKGREYAHDADRFANFKRLGAEMNLAPDKVLWVYLRKHIDSIINHINTKTSHSEPIEGRIDDAIMYLLLLKGLWRDMATAQDNIPECESVPSVITVEDIMCPCGHPKIHHGVLGCAVCTCRIKSPVDILSDNRCVCGGRGCNSCEPQGRG